MKVNVFFEHMYAAAAFCVAAVCFFSCSENETVNAIGDRSLVPSLHAKDVATVVSDSGITRYRINTPEWFIYDKAEDPYWDFPDGLHLERFNAKLSIDAEMNAKKAIYYTKRKLWDLRDSVHALNLEGERFDCNQLFWDEDKEIVYSDDTITIHQADKKIVGKGFLSNQELTKYEIRNVMGVFPISEE